MYYAERVAVDWQPADKNRPWEPEAKRRWCHERDIVYVPIYLNEQVTVGQFMDRLKAEREGLFNATKRPKSLVPDPVDPEPTTAPTVETLLADPATVTALRDLAERRLLEGGRVFGAAKERKLSKLFNELLGTLKQAMLDGQVEMTQDAVTFWLTRGGHELGK
jgi:hypothetical protein